MDWQELCSRIPADSDMPARTATLNALSLVLTGEQYSVLQHPFSKERSDAGEYIPLDQRRPSVRTGICRTVVDDSVSLVFGEDHFPAVTADDDGTVSTVADLIREASLPEGMLSAATMGAVGSIAVMLQVIERRPLFAVMPTANLTPAWQKARPKLLASVTERYKVKGSDLRVQGYAIPDQQMAATFWFQRVWDDQMETWFIPQTLADATAGKAPAIDTAAGRTVRHGLGFVPIVWIRNLPGGTDPDGACTFAAAIDTVIEADYLLSQSGRGLKFASDPTLVIKDPSAGITGAPARTGGSATALTLPPEGDAHLLEINGAAAKTVLEQVRYLRSLALEAIHGNRSDSDRVTAAQSGSAIVLMHQSLIWLAGRLRQSYGEHGLLELLRMVCAASQVVSGGLIVGGDEAVVLDPAGLELRWPPYFRPTNADLLQNAQALVTALKGGIVSQPTAVTAYSAMTDVDDAEGELRQIQQDQAQAAADALAVAQATAASAVRADANVGKTATREETA